MDFGAQLMAEISRKRKQVKNLEVKDGDVKYVRGSDVEAKREKEYYEKLEKKAKVEKKESSVDVPVKKTEERKAVDERVPLVEVQRRLRARNQPILLFGEEQSDVRERLYKVELDLPENSEGWSNELQTAMQDIGKELDKEVIEGSSKNDQKHDVALPSSFDDDWSKIEQRSTLLGVGDDMNRDCDIILSIIRYLLGRWGKVLNDRPSEVKKTPQGIHEASVHKQTTRHMKHLSDSLERYTCNNDIRHHLAKICRLLVLDRNYIVANNAYMEMAIGNAPWPVGVTRSGIHQRPGSAKSYVSNIAHVLNDETQRKYIQAFKRLMTKMQEYFPTDPSKCVEFVKPT